MRRERTDFLLEIGCEEIPARMIAKAAGELQVILEKMLTSEHLVDEGGAVETFGAPRRLVAAVQAVRVRQKDLTRGVTGPPKSVAYDSGGRPTKAAESFAAKQGVPVEALKIVPTERGECVHAEKIIRGRPAAEILAQILPRAIAEIPWPRSMYWARLHGPRFIRPVRWIVALLAGRVVPLEFAGVRSGKFSAGHRFLGKAKVPVSGVRDFEKNLKKNFVLVRPDDRRKKIQREMRKERLDHIREH